MCKLRDDNGFTLLEILVAITLLCIGLLAMAALTAGIMRGNLFSNQLTTATTLAQDQMEEIRRLGYSGVADDNEDYGDISGYPLYKRVTSVADPSPAANMKTVTVTVYWDSDAHSVELKTILAQ